ncbi:MAG: hypothetical protein LBI39_02545 [Puniceicoccales bacterium]|jgi:hypothetical protein|nr:hypothetical protein [Puniceicoccales bacterium]
MATGAERAAHQIHRSAAVNVPAKPAFCATAARAMTAISCSPIGWVLVPIVAIVGVAINGIISAALLVSGNGRMVRSLWQTYYRSIAVCFTCHWAFSRSKSHYGRINMVDVKRENIASGAPFSNSGFSGLLRDIGNSHAKAKRYDGGKMDAPIDGDTIHRETHGMDCRMANTTLTVKDLDEIGVPHDSNLGGADAEVRPVIIWFDGAQSFGEIWQGAINLAGLVPPIVQDGYDFAKSCLEAIADYNRNSENKIKLVPFTAGHSLGAMVAFAAAAKLHCASIGFNGVGLGDGIVRRFIGKDDMERAEENGMFLSLVSKDDEAGDPSNSNTYRRRIGTTYRFSRSGSQYGHYGYDEMLNDFL